MSQIKFNKLRGAAALMEDGASNVASPARAGMNEDAPAAKRQCLEAPPMPSVVDLTFSAPDASATAAVSSTTAPAAVGGNHITGVSRAAASTSTGSTPSSHLQEVDLSFVKFEGKPLKFIKRATGEAKRLLSARGMAENKQEGLCFSLKDRDNLSKWAVTVKDLNPEGKLLKDLERLGLDASIDLELCLPDNYPLEPPFVRVVYPQLSGGFVFGHGGICFEPLTDKGWAPSMTLPALCISIKGILDYGDVRAVGAGDKLSRTVPQFTEAGARQDHHHISKAHKGGDARTYGGRNKS